MEKIEEGFKALDLKPSALKCIAVAQGPGSYTGIRVGAAAAKGLSFPFALPFIPFCTLEGFVSDSDGPFLSIIDARIGGAYVLVQKRIGKEVTLLSSPQLISPEQLPPLLSTYPLQIGPHNAYPNPHHLASLAAKKIKEEKYTTDIELLYLRTPEYQKSPFSLP